MAMMLRRLGLINKSQLGFTLIELTLAFTISAVITGAITVTLHQMLTGNLRTSNHMTAVSQVQDAGYWVSHDAHMAQSITTGNDPADTGFPLTLTWSYWAIDSGDVSKEHQAVYTLEDMPGGGLKNLVRTHYEDGTAKTNSVIAKFIDTTLDEDDQPRTRCVWDSGVLTFTVTATVGTGSGEQSETRTYEVVPRAIPQ